MSAVELAGSDAETTAKPAWAAFARSAWAVLAKDARCELRTRHALGAVLLFAVTSTVAVSFTLTAWGSKGPVAAALVWLVIYFSAMSGLSRVFVREQETHTAPLLRLAAPPNAVYLGKLAFNLALMLAIEVVTVPLFVLLMGCRVASWGSVICILIMGSLGLSVGATTSAAMVARARARGALYAAISFPLLIPVLAVAVLGTEAAMAGSSAVAQDLRLILYYVGAVLTASLMLFRFIWED